ncbi:hypothetical protein CKA32_003509 [Geitlerinema sp. FC II]|nr:hypothetical protein CKA32_003509 [Geitlerinema sp. FC II]
MRPSIALYPDFIVLSELTRQTDPPLEDTAIDVPQRERILRTLHIIGKKTVLI